MKNMRAVVMLIISVCTGASCDGVSCRLGLAERVYRFE